MSFQYDPLSEEECEKARQFPLLEPGVYNFQIGEATGKVSQSGNSMIELKLKIWDNTGKEFLIFDYLIGTGGMAWKTKHFCDSVGLQDEYKDSKFHESLCPGRAGKASIIQQAGKAKPGGGFYKDKNVVEDYVMTDAGALKVPLSESKDNFSDSELPF